MVGRNVVSRKTVISAYVTARWGLYFGESGSQRFIKCLIVCCDTIYSIPCADGTIDSLTLVITRYFSSHEWGHFQACEVSPSEQLQFSEQSLQSPNTGDDTVCELKEKVVLKPSPKHIFTSSTNCAGCRRVSKGLYRIFFFRHFDFFPTKCLKIYLLFVSSPHVWPS